MKSFIVAILTLSALIAQANEENLDLYHTEKPDASVALRPTIPTLSSPAPLAKVAAAGLTLQWSKVDEASAYALQVSADPIFFALLVNEPLYKETSYVFKDVKLEAGKKYYWRVAAIKEGNLPGTIKSLFNRSSFTVQ